MLAILALLPLACVFYVLIRLLSRPTMGLAELVLHQRHLSTAAQWLPGSASPPVAPEQMGSKPKVVPGLQNIGGNACFLNSSLQAIASLTSLEPFLSSIQDLSRSTGIPTPVADALSSLLADLNNASVSPRTLRPSGVISALLRTNPQRSRAILNSDQQDAQEFFTLLLACVLEELQKLEKAVLEQESQEEGIHSLQRAQSPVGPIAQPIPKTHNAQTPKTQVAKNPFQSLVAHRLACVTCGYVEAIRHLSSDQLSLNVPLQSACRLEDVLGEYTKLELLDEYTCRKCSLEATVQHLEEVLKETASAGEMTASKKKRVKELKKQLERVRAALQEDVERQLDGIKLVKMARPASKHAMIARPADAFVVHLSRSTQFSYTGHPIKNNCCVLFGQDLVLDPFCTNGQLSSRPEAPISAKGAFKPTNADSDAADPCSPPKHIYRLVAMVVHQGSHSYGHYITFRRLPSTAGIDQWFRISDANVRPSSPDEVLAANPFLLFYERRTSSLPLQQQVARNTASLHARTIHRSELKSTS